MANPLDFLSKAGNITNPLAIGATILGGIGSIFGSGSKREIPPELQAVYDMVMKQAKEGLSDEAIDAILRRTKTGLGQEAGALSSLTESRLTRSGAGVGVKEAALRRIDKERLRGIGEATTDTLLADEEAKQRALAQLQQLAPLFGDFTTETGQGFADLFGSGLGFLLNRPQQGNQPPQTRGFLDRNDFGEPFDPNQRLA
jgi:hypothetical protein